MSLEGPSQFPRKIPLTTQVEKTLDGLLAQRAARESLSQGTELEEGRETTPGWISRSGIEEALGQINAPNTRH